MRTLNFRRGPLTRTAWLFLLVTAPAFAVDMLVVNTSEEINGDTSSPLALIASPGPDGISLWEAVAAANNTEAADAIGFDPTLAGSVLMPGGFVPSIWQPLTIDGDVDGDGDPDITLDGVSSSASEGVMVFSSDVTIRGLTIRRYTDSAIKVFTWEGGGPTELERIHIENNAFEIAGTALWVYNWGSGHRIEHVLIRNNTFFANPGAIQMEAALGSDQVGNLLANVVITGNSIVGDGSDRGLFFRAAGDPRSTNNQIVGLEISHNSISGYSINALSITVAQQADTSNNRIEELSILKNQITGGLGITCGQGEASSLNVLADAEIVGNTISGPGSQGINLTCGDGAGAQFNEVTDLLIAANEIVGSLANGVRVSAGGNGASGNRVQRLTLSDNLIRECDDAGILLHGEGPGSPDNTIEVVHIRNNTLVENGNLVWAGGLNINTLDPSNLIQEVHVFSTILWGNSFDDAIKGALVPDAVQDSILGDVRFLGPSSNFYLDPEFVNPVAADYRLQSSSPAVDEGDPAPSVLGASDLWGNQRTWDGDGHGAAVVDIGAHEFDAPNDLTLTDVTVDSPTSFAGCHSVAIDGAFVVVAGGAARVHSTGKVTFGNGLAVGIDGALSTLPLDAARCEPPT